MSRKSQKSTRIHNARASKRIGILVVATLPIAAFLGIVVIKLLFMMLFTQLSISQAAAGDYKSALTNARWNLIANVFEPWRAYYNVGTAELGLELYDDSRNTLSFALQTAPMPDACQVRTNLALAIEGQGDLASENDEFEDAVDYYAQALAMLDNMPAECESESASDSSDSSDEDSESDDSESDQSESDQSESEQSESDQSESDQSESDGTLGEQTEQTKERLGEKGEQAGSDLKEQQEQEAQDGAGGEQPEGEGESQGPTPLDELGDRMDEAEQDRSDWDSVDRSQSAPFDLPDKPW